MRAKNEPRLSAQAHRTLICLMRAGSASFARISSDTKKRVSIYIHTISTLIEVVDDGRRGSALLHRLQVRVKTESSETSQASQRYLCYARFCIVISIPCRLVGPTSSFSCHPEQMIRHETWALIAIRTKNYTL